MKIGFIGTGSLGLTLLAFFKKSGFDVFAYDKNRDLVKKIENDGFEINLNGNFIKIPPIKFYKSFKRLLFEDLDFLIISVKTYNLSEIAKELKKISFNIPIVLVQNGLEIEKFFKGKKYIYRYICHLAVFKDKNLKINAKYLLKKNFICGENKKKGIEISKSFCLAGLNTEYKKNIKKYIWEKTILNSLLNPLCAIFQRNMEDTLKIKGVDLIIKKILKEGIEVGRKEGVKFSRTLKEMP